MVTTPMSQHPLTTRPDPIFFYLKQFPPAWRIIPGLVSSLQFPNFQANLGGFGEQPYLGDLRSPWLLNVTNHLTTGMILQIPVPLFFPHGPLATLHILDNMSHWRKLSCRSPGRVVLRHKEKW